MDNGTKLRLLREHHGYSQEYVANELDISQSTYFKLESGQTKLTVERAKQLAKFYNISPEYFLSDESTYIHFGKDNSFGPIQNNTNKYFDEENKGLYEKLVQEKDKRLLEKDLQIKELNTELKVLRGQLQKFMDKLTE